MSQKVLDILLQKNDTRIPWGFSLCAGPDGAVLIDKVFPGALASQYLNPGDRLLSIDGKDCTKMSTTEASQIATRPANALNLLVAKNADKVVHRQYSDTAAPAVNWSTPVINVRVRSTPVTNVRFTPDPNLRSTPVASVLSDDNVRTTTNSNVRSTTNSNVRPAAAVSSSQEAWRRRCRQSTSPSSSARRAKAAFWERCTSPQRQPRLPPPDHLPPPPSDYRSSRSASSGRSTPTRFCSDADVASEPDVDRRRLSADWDSSKSDSGRGSYGRQQSCPSWITNSNESLNFHNSRKLESTASSESREHRANYNQTSTHESRSRTADSRFSSHEKENDSKWFSNHNSRSKTADNAFNAHEKEDAKWIRSQETRSGVDSHENQDKWIPSHETKSEINNSLFNSRENQDSKWVRSHETRSGVDDSRFNSYVKDDIKRIPSQETKSVIDDSLFNSQEKENTTRWATSHDLRSDTAHNQYGSNGKENNTKRLPNQETSFTHVDSSESKTQKEEEDLKWFSSQEVKYGYVDSEARTHFVEDSKWPPSSLDKRFEFVDSESKILHEKEQSEVNKKWSEMVQSNSTSKSSFHDEKFSSLPKNFERHKFENLFDSSETKKEIDKKVASETSSREDYSSQMCTREEKRQETQESYRLESSSHRTTSKKCLETEFEKSFEQFAKMMQTGEESLLFKKAEEIVLEDESKMLSEQMSENFKETERRFESYVKDLNATDNANVEKKFEKTVMEKSEEMSVTRSHTPAGFYDNHQEASGEMEEKKKVESDKTSDASRDAASTPNVEKRPRPASEFLDRQGLYDAFNRLRSSSPSDVNETLFRICDVLQTDARTSIETGLCGVWCSERSKASRANVIFKNAWRREVGGWILGCGGVGGGASPDRRPKRRRLHSPRGRSQTLFNFPRGFHAFSRGKLPAPR
ncbi:hypothetical protein LSTR_LSTR014313 [Laodelphax striatellus]|uniref:PDZ domain-containing protein n=1 Tax=Laodelphax striatellus TaxID=195883 RepID=A0A482XAQ3_LAOST|nr:hypothetical protein LSTR_LSTR014313 [Laodelphax striatellus]